VDEIRSLKAIFTVKRRLEQLFDFHLEIGFFDLLIAKLA